MTTTAVILPECEQIKQRRLEMGLSQAKVEDSLGWGRGNLSKYEKGTTKIPADRKEELWEFYGLGAKKVADFFGFKETETPRPVKDTSRGSSTHNAEGYTDPTMAEALKKAMAATKYTDPLPGEVWTNYRNNGGVLSKLILSVEGNTAYCLTVFTKGASYDFKVKCKAGFTYYVAFDRMEAIKLKDLKERKAIISSKSFEEVKLHFAGLMGIAVVEKTVEVPVEVEKVVEKEVVKEVPVEVIKEVEREAPVIDSFEFEMCKRERDIYKDIVDRLLPSKTLL